MSLQTLIAVINDMILWLSYVTEQGLLGLNFILDLVILAGGVL